MTQGMIGINYFYGVCYIFINIKHLGCKYLLYLNFFFLLNIGIYLILMVLGRKRKWFKLEDALNMLRLHKPTQHTYLESFALNKQKANV